MRILGITQTSHEDGIEFADLASVKQALRLFADGGTPGSRETAMHGFGTGIEGGFGLVMKTILDDRQESSFMSDLLAGVDRVDEETTHYRSYDYDGVGPFFKTTVEVSAVQVGETRARLRRTPQLVYLLSLRAAYVGDKPCAGLASSLGASRSLISDRIEFNLAPNGDRFEINFDVAAEKLRELGLSSMTGEQIATHIMEQAPEYEGKTSVTLVNDGIAVIFGIVRHSVDGPLDRKTGRMVWVQNGAMISGPLGQSYEDGVPFATPRLFALITVPEEEGGRSWMRKPIVDPAIKQAIHDQASAIVAAFR